MSTAPLSTLHHVTERKLKKIAAQQEIFETGRRSILAKVAAAPDQISKIEAFLEGFERHGIKPKNEQLVLADVKRFVAQAKRDPSVTASMLHDWHRQLERELDISMLRFEHAALFGKLVIEWIEHPNPATTVKKGGHAESDSVAEDDFQAVGRKEMHDQRQQWERYAFTERPVDKSRIEIYLDDIFSTVQQANMVSKTPLKILRDRLKTVLDFKSDLKTEKPEDEHNIVKGQHEDRFTTEKLKACIRGVLKADLLVGAKRDALAALQDQPAVLTELVDVLNMDLDSLDTWQWDPVPVKLHMRRQLNQKYRVYMNEETHQAILLYFIGNTWAVAFRQAFTTFYKSGQWAQRPHQPMGRIDRERREYFALRDPDSAHTVRGHREAEYEKEYFMRQLPENAFQDVVDYGDASGRPGGASYGLATKQSLLRRVTAEMILNTKIYGEFQIVQSDFKWFGPSLPHDTIFAVLKFFGVPAKWLRFFKTFLECPVAFAQDGPSGQIHTRRCGVPMSHLISDALSEAVLFCLDFAVNKRTKGANIFRFHDDLWFWGQQSTCIQAWEAIEEFSRIMGLELNKDKTGAALVKSDKSKATAVPDRLPQGKIKWGLLYLDEKAGRWLVDSAKVDEHIEELRHQLGACRSIMAWVQAWNGYVDHFFSQNLGLAANCLGRAHNDMVIDTFSYIQRKLFAETGTNNAAQYLRTLLVERFGIADTVPDGFFYFPVELGGLGLRNPLIDPFQTYEHSHKSAEKPIDEAFESEQDMYLRLKESWELGHTRPSKRMKIEFSTDSSAKHDGYFMSFEEYTRFREETSTYVYLAYRALLDEPAKDWGAMQLQQHEQIREAKVEVDAYLNWVLNLYASDVKKKYGGRGLVMGERDMLPIALVDDLKKTKVRWQG